MKFNEMNKRQQKAFVNIAHAANFLVGGLENDAMNGDEKSIELLENHEWLVNELYRMSTTSLYGNGYVCFDEKTVQKELRDINFCGKEWLMERCEKRISKLEKEGFCY